MGLFSTPITGRQVFLGLILFFAIMLSADVALIYWSLKTHPGTVSDDAYREGLAYNQKIEAARRQAALGWKADADFEITPSLNGASRRTVALTFNLREATGAGVSGQPLVATFFRPATRGLDERVTLNESVSGTYVGVVELAQLGQWRLVIETQSEATEPSAAPAFRYEDIVIIE
ncbi:MAG: FixH family protein [Pseudomonadota bacterium]